MGDRYPIKTRHSRERDNAKLDEEVSIYVDSRVHERGHRPGTETESSEFLVKRRIDRECPVIPFKLGKQLIGAHTDYPEDVQIIEGFLNQQDIDVPSGMPEESPFDKALSDLGMHEIRD